MRIRLLPVLMFALVGTITIKAGTLWNAFDVSVGSESRAQESPTEATAAPETPATPPAEPSASTPEAAQPAEAEAPTTALPPAEGITEASTGEGHGAGVDSTTVTADPGLDEQQVHD